MKKNYSLSFLFLIFLFFLIDISYEASSNQRKNLVNNKNNSNDKVRERKKRANIKNRKLDDDEEEEEHDIDYYFQNLTFKPLKIYIDSAEFNKTFKETFPSDSDIKLDDFIIAMNRAKDILEYFLEINIDTTESIDFERYSTTSDEYIQTYYGINNWTSVFDCAELKFDEFNFLFLQNLPVS